MKSWLKHTLQITTSFAEELIDGSLSEGVLKTVGKQIKQYFSSPDTIKSNYTTAIERSVSSIEIALKGTRAYYPTREKEFYKTHFGKFEQNVFNPFARQAIQSGIVSSEDQLRNACIEECDEFKKILPSIVQMDDASNQEILSLVTPNATENPSQKMLEDISNSMHSKYLVPMLQKNNILYTGIIYHFNCILQSNPEFGTYLQNIQVTQLQHTIQQLQANTQRDAYNEARIDRLEQYIQAMSAYNDQMGAIGQKLDDLYEKTLQTYEVLERLEEQMKSNFQAMDDRLSAITNMIQRGFQSFAAQPEQPMQPAQPTMRRETPVTRTGGQSYAQPAQPIYASTPQQRYKTERSAQATQGIKQAPASNAQATQETRQTPASNAQATQGIKQTPASNAQATQERKQASVITKQSMQEIKQSPVFNTQPTQETRQAPASNAQPAQVKRELDSNSQFMEEIKQSPIFNPQLAQDIRQSSAFSQQLTQEQENSFKVMNDLGKMYALFLENAESQYQASKENNNNEPTKTASPTIPAFFQASQLNANAETSANDNAETKDNAMNNALFTSIRANNSTKTASSTIPAFFQAPQLNANAETSANNNAETKDNAMNNALFTSTKANNSIKTASPTIPAFFQASQLNANAETNANNNAETKDNAMPTISQVPNTTTLPDIFQNFLQPKK